MPLSKSLLATAAIFALVWLAVFLNTRGHRLGEQAPDHSNLPSDQLTVIELVGVNAMVDLGENRDSVNSLWAQFHDLTDLHLAVDAQMSQRIYGLYRFQSPDLTSAELFIGYNTGGRHLDQFSAITRFSLADYQAIYESFDSANTLEAWDLMDNNQPVHALLEEYELDDSDTVIATRVYVDYQ